VNQFRKGNLEATQLAIPRARFRTERSTKYFRQRAMPQVCAEAQEV